jgi:hypothetical protein
MMPSDEKVVQKSVLLLLLMDSRTAVTAFGKLAGKDMFYRRIDVENIVRADVFGRGDVLPSSRLNPLYI